MRLSKLLALGLSGVVALTGVTVARQASAGPRAAAVPNPVTLRVGTWNICGEFDGCPSVTAFQTKANMVTTLVKSKFLHAIMLSEVCEWHVSEILRQFRAIDPTWNAHFAPVRQLDTANGWIARRTRVCDRAQWSNVTANKHVLGVAVLSNGGFDQPTEYDLPTANAEYATDTPMVCVRKLEPRVRLCESHLTAPGIDPGDVVRGQQITRALEIIDSFGAERVVWGGDFNEKPPNGGGNTLLNPVYDRMRECAQVDADNNPATPDARTGGDTARWGTATDPGYGKIDYLFVKSQNTNGPELVASCPHQAPTAAATPHSDHAPVYGTFLL